MSAIRLVGTDWNVEPMVLPDAAPTFALMRQSADEVFDFRDMDEWLSRQLEPHVLEVGEMQVSREMAVLEQKKEEEDVEKYEKWNDEVAERIEESRDAVTTYYEELRQSSTEVEWRLREEEVAARERLVYEHQAMEARLLKQTYRRAGLLQHVPTDQFSWTVEWMRAPQEFEVNVTSLRGVRAKLRDGYYVLLVSVVDRVGGKTLRFSTGERNLDCNEALPPLRFKARSGQVERYINKAVNLMCPAPEILQTYACLVFEVWQLKVGKYDPTDKVVGWGVWPLVNKDFKVVEGRFKLPMMKGEVNPGIDTYRAVTTAIQNDLKYWLGNLYFEVRYRRAKHDDNAALVASKVQMDQDFENADQLRLHKTTYDYNHLIVPKLPPRLFFDDVSLDQKGAASGLRRRYFGSTDARPLNSALWEKRSLLEKEREAMHTEFVRRKSKSLMGDEDDEVQEARIRADLNSGKPTLRKIKSILLAEEDIEQNKARDSHILLYNHHIALMSQREFFFLGRRYRDRFQIAASVLKYDLGINHGGPWDKAKVITNLIFFIFGLLARMLLHNVGLYLYLSFLDVPLTRNEWSVFYADIRFDHTTRFNPRDTMVTSFIGFAAAIGFFFFFAIAAYLLLRVFEAIPYAGTRFLLWYGVAVFLDPLIQSAQEAALGDFHSGDPFMFANQMEREEGSALSGIFLTALGYAGMMFIQSVAVYWFACACHLNGRVNDVYDRLLFPESSFFIPHDLEISELEMFEVIKKAKNWRSESGDVKKVTVNDFNHHQTCFFRARLFRLVSIMTDTEDWVREYCDAIPLRRPHYAKGLIEANLGSYQLGADIISFVKRNFPHLTMMTDYRVGDSLEDYYYEGELLRGIQTHSTSNEDDLEMRMILKAYFQAQVHGEKPACWDFTKPGTIIIKDRQLLADLIFFETSRPTVRQLYLAKYIRKYTDQLFSVDPDAGVVARAELPNFDRMNPDVAMSGHPTEGSIIHITLLNPAQGTRQLSRAFVITPFGFIIEPSNVSFSFLAHHTADNAEFWAAKAVAFGRQMEIEFQKDDEQQE